MAEEEGLLTVAGLVAPFFLFVHDPGDNIYQDKQYGRAEKQENQKICTRMPDFQPPCNEVQHLTPILLHNVAGSLVLPRLRK